MKPRSQLSAFIVMFVLMVGTIQLAFAQCYNFTSGSFNVPLTTREYAWGAYKYCNVNSYWRDYYCTDSTWTATLRRYFKFNESNGTTIDSATGAATTNGSITQYPIVGFRNGSYYFDGASSYVNAGSAADVDDLGGSGASSANMSVSMWIFPSGMGENSNGQLIGKDSGGSTATPTNGWTLRFNGTNALRFTVDNVTTDLVRQTSNNAVTLNTWNHVVLTWTGSNTATNVHIYVNGTEASYATTTNGSGNKNSDAANDLVIGNNKTSGTGSLSRTFYGSIDEVYVFSGILSSTERTTLLSHGCTRSGSCSAAGQLNYNTTTRSYEMCDGVNTMAVGCTAASSGSAPEDIYTPPPTANLLGWWKLDETSGTFADSSGNGYTGTAKNSGRMTYNTTGKINGALQLTPVYGDDTTVPHVDVGAGFTFSLPVTMTAWVNPTNYDDYRTIVGKRITYGGNQELLQWTFGQGAGQMYVEGGNGTFALFDYIAPTNTWTHLAVVVTSTGTYLYVNGAMQEVSNSITLGTSVAGAHFNIGDNGEVDSGGTDADPWLGKLDDVRVYSGILTGDQIAAVYNDTLANKLAGWWKLDESSGTSVADSSSTGTTGTAANGPVFSPTTGRIKGAIDFDGSDDYVDLGTSTAIKFSGDMGISAWIKPDTVGIGTILSDENTDGYQFYVYDNGGGSYKVGLWSGNAGAIEATIPLILGQWQQVGASVQSGTVTLYYNGQSYGTGAFNNVAPSGSTHTYIGQWGGGELFDGKIDDVRLWSRALDAGEMDMLYKQAGPVGWWKLDESSGTAAADQQTNNPGTLTNGPTWAPTGGVVNGALGFDNTNDFVSIANESNFDFDYLQPMSVSAWVNRTSSTGEDDIIEKYDPGSFAGWAFWFDPSSTLLHFNINGGGGNLHVASVGSVTTGAWHHVVATYSGGGSSSGIKLYIDGAPASTTSLNNTLAGSALNNVNVAIGADNGTSPTLPTSVFDGSLDDVRVYDRVLSASEVKGMYNQGSPSGLVAWWKMDESTGDTAYDSSGNGFNATVTDGSPAVWLPTNGAVKGTAFFNSYLDFEVPETGTTALDFANGSSMTMSFWLQPVVVPSGTQEIIFKQGGNYFFEFGSGLFTFGFYNAGWQTWTSSYVQYFPYQWTHYAVTYTFGTASSAHVYVNGTEIAGSWAGDGNLAPPVDDYAIIIGASAPNPASESFTGGIDDIRIYNTILSAAQISQLYTSTTPGSCMSLGACTRNGAVEMDSVTGLLKWCNGSQWLPLTTP